MYTFVVATLKGTKGSIEVEEDATVEELYGQVQRVIGWADAEGDYYVLILSGKKLMDYTALVANYKPNPTRAQLIVTKLTKPDVKRVYGPNHPSSIAKIEEQKTLEEKNRAAEEEKKNIAEKKPNTSEEKKPNTSDEKKQDITTEKQTIVTQEKKQEVSGTVTTPVSPKNTMNDDDTSGSVGTNIAPKEDTAMADGPSSTSTSSPQPTSASTSTNNAPTEQSGASGADKTTNTPNTPSQQAASPTQTQSADATTATQQPPFDPNIIPGLDFIPVLGNRRNLGNFFEVLGILNPDLSRALQADPVRLGLFMDLCTRKAYHEDIDMAKALESREAKYQHGVLRRQRMRGGPAPPQGQRANQANLTPEQRRQQNQAEARARIEAQLTPDDKTKISQLTELGFSTARATQAYLLCDKNPELAANYLFSQME